MAKTLNQLIAEKFGLIDQADKDLLKAITSKEKEFFKQLLDFINLFATKNGKIDPSELSNQQVLNRISGFLNKIINTSTFKSEVSKYLKVFDQVEAMQKKILELGAGLDLSDFNLNTEKQLAIQEIVDGLMNPDMIRANMVNPVKKIVYRHVTTGINIQDARDELNTFINGQSDKSNGYLTKFVKTITTESLARYDGMINQKVVTEFDLDAFRIVGSIIRTSMPVCISMINESGRFEDMAINGKYAVADIPKIIAKISGDPGFVKGTNPTNYFVNRNHWGCRHQFIPTRFTEADLELLAQREGGENEKAEQIEGFSNFPALLQAEKEIRGNDFETLIVYNSKGKEVFRKIGDKSRVDIDDSEIPFMKGNIVTHNHPSSASFSFTDVNFSSITKPKEIRAVGSKYGYYMKPESGKWPGVDKIKRVYDDANYDVKWDFLAKMRNGEISIEFANLNHHHEVWKIVAEKLKLIYKRVENDI